MLTSHVHHWSAQDELRLLRRLLDHMGLLRRLLDHTGLLRRLLDHTGLLRWLLDHTGLLRRLLDHTGLLRWLLDHMRGLAIASNARGAAVPRLLGVEPRRGDLDEELDGTRRLLTATCMSAHVGLPWGSGEAEEERAFQSR